MLCTQVYGYLTDPQKLLMESIGAIMYVFELLGKEVHSLDFEKLLVHNALLKCLARESNSAPPQSAP